MNKNADKKTIFITGCSSGIGLTAAVYLRDMLNFRVIASCRKTEGKKQLEEKGFETLLLDLDDSVSIQNAAQRVIELSNNRLYALFNNAGFGVYGALESLTRHDFETQFSTNLFGIHELTMQLLPAMRRHNEGRIIQTSSVMGFITTPRRGLYAASKFALEAWSDTLRMELHGTGIKVSLIEPGPLATNFNQNTHQMADNSVVNPPLAKTFTLTADHVMPKLKHALVSHCPKLRYRITLVSHVMWYVQKWLPGRVVDWLLRKNS